MSMNYKLTNKIGCTREYYETFIYPDGQSLTRRETPAGGYMDENRGNIQLDYSYINPDTTVVWVAFSGFERALKKIKYFCNKKSVLGSIDCKPR